MFLDVIDGAVVPAADGATMDIVDPATGQVYATAPNSSAAEVEHAFPAAAALAWCQVGRSW